MSKLDELIAEMCPDGVQSKKIKLKIMDICWRKMRTEVMS